MKSEPKTLLEAIKHFADPDVTHNLMVSLRWPHGVHCPTCGRTDVRFISTRRIWECKEKHPRRQFSSKIGTIFEDSPLGLDKWFAAIWMVANCKNGISSYEMARDLGITQKSAWFLDHRIRLAMKAGSIDRREWTLSCFVKAFATKGYVKRANSSPERGIEKIAIYATKEERGRLVPQHATRQLADGRWTSKIGELEDIKHLSLKDVNCRDYGSAVRFMKRPRAP